MKRTAWCANCCAETYINNSIQFITICGMHDTTKGNNGTKGIKERKVSGKGRK